MPCNCDILNLNDLYPKNPYLNPYFTENTNPQMVYLYSILIFLAIVALVATFVYLRFFKKKHTRERFAFVALLTVGVLIANAIAIIAGGSFFTEFLRAISNQFLGTATPEPIGTSEKLMIISLILMMIFMVYFLYRNWTGSISTREAKAKELGNHKFNLITDALVVISGEKLEISDKKADDYRREVFPEINTKRLPWHIRAAQLLKLSDPQYDIDLGDYDLNTRIQASEDNPFQQLDPGKDWYQKYKSYLSKYGDKSILIFCSEKTPRQGEIDHITKEFTGKFEKLIIAVESNDDYARIHSNDYEIEFENEHKLLSRLVNFKGYQSAVEREFARALTNSERSLHDIYVPLKAYHYMPAPESTRLERGEDIPNVEQYVLDWAQDENHSKQHLAIVGEYGQGKSVLSLKIAKEMLADREKYHRLPIVVELRGTSPRNLDIFGILGRFANPYGLNTQALLQLHRAGKLLIILEGFDEMDLVGDTEMLMAHFQQLWQLAREAQAKIIITGRPNLFTDDPQRRQALGIHTHRAHLPYTRAVHLDKMTDLQIRQALRNTTPDVREGILQALADSPDQSSFAELVTRPSTLYQLSTVWGDEIGKDTRRLNAAAVIGKFIQNDYDRQSAKPVEMPLTADERSYFIMGIAVAMMLESGYTNQIKKAALRDVVQKLLDNFPEIQPYRDTQQGKKQGKLPDRLKENHKALDTVFRDVIAGGILVTDLSGSDTFRFAHKSYLEYLVSDFYVNFILQDDEREYDLKIANAVRKALNFKDNQLEQSIDLYYFIAQLITNRIRLRNKKTGVEIPIEGNEEVYSKAIFDALIPSWWSRRFPNLMFWLGLHKSLIPLHSIAVLTLIMGFTSLWFENIYTALLSIAGHIFWFIGFYALGLLREDERIKIITQSTIQLVLWVDIVNNMELTKTPPIISKRLKEIISFTSYQIAVSHIIIQLAYSLVVIIIGVSMGLSILNPNFITFSSVIIGFIFTFGVMMIISRFGSKNSQFVMEFLGLFLMTPILIMGIWMSDTMQINGIFTFISLFPIFLICISTITIFREFYVFHSDYKVLLKAEQTRQAEAGQPDA